MKSKIYITYDAEQLRDVSCSQKVKCANCGHEGWLSTYPDGGNLNHPKGVKNPDIICVDPRASGKLLCGRCAHK